MEWRRLVWLPDYEISENGDVRRLTVGGRRYPIGYTVKPKRHPKGYVCYTLATPDGPKTILGHRLVIEAFIGSAPTPWHETAHGDGSRTNNNFRNLRWATPRENQADRKRHNTYLSGESGTATKLSDTVVSQIRHEYRKSGVRYRGGGVTMQNLADRHGVSVAQISRLVNDRQRATYDAS